MIKCVLALIKKIFFFATKKKKRNQLLKKKGAKVFDRSGGRPMKGWLLVSAEGTKAQKDFDW